MSEPAAVEDTSSDERVIVREQDGITTITINRPEARNAMTSGMWAALEGVCRKLQREPLPRVVVLQGAGGTFSAGLDIPELHGRPLAEVERSFAVMHRAIVQVERLPVPVLGVLRGVAAGGGCELLLACDLRIAARTARIGMPIARLGITIGRDFAQRLVHLVGPSRARDLLFTSRLARGTEAYRWGLVNYVAPDGEVEARTQRIAQRIAAQSPTSHLVSKRNTAWPPRDAQEAPHHRYTGNPEEFREGVAAWIEKRDPVFPS